MNTPTLNKQALIDAAAAAAAALEAELASYDERVKAYRRKLRDEWMKTSRPQLREVRDRLTKALQTCRPITAQDIRPYGKRIDDLLYYTPSDHMLRRDLRTPRGMEIKELRGQVDRYKGLIKALQAHSGDQISINQLRLLGINKIGELFVEAAKSEATS